MHNKLVQPLSKRAIVSIGLAIVASVFLGLAGRALYRKVMHRPLTTAQVRGAIWDYLEERSERSEFKSALPALSNAQPTLITRTNKAGRVKTKLIKKNEANPQRVLTREFHNALAEAADYRTIYGLIGDQLASAEKLLATSDAPQKEAGLLVVLDANRAAQQDASDAWLSARICEAYLWPYVELADSSKNGKLSAQNILDLADRAFRQAGETNNLIRNYRLLIRTTPTSRRADAARLRLARLLEDQQDFKAALQCLCEIQDTNNPALQQRVAMLKQRLQARK